MGIRQPVRERLAALHPHLSALRKDIEGLDEKTVELKENLLQRVAGFEGFLSSLDDSELVGYMEREVTRYGSGAKVNCPKEYLGKKALLVVLKD